MQGAYKKFFCTIASDIRPSVPVCFGAVASADGRSTEWRRGIYSISGNRDSISGCEAPFANSSFSEFQSTLPVTGFTSGGFECGPGRCYVLVLEAESAQEGAFSDEAWGTWQPQAAAEQPKASSAQALAIQHLQESRGLSTVLRYTPFFILTIQRSECHVEVAMLNN